MKVRLDLGSTTKKRESRSKLNLFFLNNVVAWVKSKTCVGVFGMLLCRPLGGLTAALPIAAGPPPTCGIVVKVQNRERVKKWDNSNLAALTGLGVWCLKTVNTKLRDVTKEAGDRLQTPDSKIQVQEATNLNN